MTAVCGIATSSRAGAQALTCPARFPMQTLQFGRTGDDWKPGAGDLPPPLESMGLFAGPPSQGAMLQPTTADGGRVTWRLQPPYQGGLWVQCTYARNSLALSKPLPNIPRVCVAKYGKEHPNQPRVIEFSCH